MSRPIRLKTITRYHQRDTFIAAAWDVCTRTLQNWWDKREDGPKRYLFENRTYYDIREVSQALMDDLGAEIAKSWWMIENAYRKLEGSVPLPEAARDERAKVERQRLRDENRRRLNGDLNR